MQGRAAVIVTGAAGGIGRALVSALLDRDLAVIGVDVQAAVRDLDPTGQRTYRGFVADITSDTDLVALAARLTPLDGAAHLIALAGGALAEELAMPDPLDVPDDVFARSVELNLLAQYRIVRRLTPTLAATPDRDRSITFVSSINACGNFGAPAYAAAKAGLAGLVNALAVPLGRRGIRVNAVAFGTVATERGAALHRDDPGRLGRMAALSTSGQILSPEVAADVLVSVVSGLRAVTGTVITADNGQSVPGHRAT